MAIVILALTRRVRAGPVMVAFYGKPSVLTGRSPIDVYVVERPRGRAVTLRSQWPLHMGYQRPLVRRPGGGFEETVVHCTDGSNRSGPPAIQDLVGGCVALVREHTDGGQLSHEACKTGVLPILCARECCANGNREDFWA